MRTDTFRHVTGRAARVWALAAVLAIPFSAAAHNHDTHKAGSSAVADMLAEFESKTIGVRQELGNLESMTRSKRIGPESHKQRLNALAIEVNALGAMHTRLDGMKSEASELQAKAIDAARPHLAEIAGSIDTAIRLVNERGANVHLPEYREAVKKAYSGANWLFRTVDTVIDYKNARLRLEKLNPPPAERGE